QLIQDFIGNWLLVMMISVFIAQIEDFNLKTKLTPLGVTLGTIGLMVLPWIASGVIIPVVVHEYYHDLEMAPKGCSYPTADALTIFKSFDTAVPILLAIILVAVAAFLKYRRFTRGFSNNSMHTELIS